MSFAHGLKRGGCADRFCRAAAFARPPLLPEGLDYVGGGRGPGGVGFPGEGDGGARDVRHLGFEGGAGDQVWIGGSVWLHWDSKLLMANRWGGADKRNELATCTLLKTNRHLCHLYRSIKTQQPYIFEILYPIIGSKLTVDLQVCLP